MRYLLLFFLLTSCATQTKTGPVRIRDLYPIPASIEIQEKRLKKSDLKYALDLGDTVNSLRLVPVFDSQRTGTIPEYRIFEIKPGSAFDILGIRNNDVLLAAHGYILPDERQFPSYVSWLLTQKSTEIEVRRGGKPVLLKITVN